MGWFRSVIETERVIEAEVVVVLLAGERIVTVGGAKEAACWMVTLYLEAGSGSPRSLACTTSGL
jgi:hypothetical protein